MKQGTSFGVEPNSTLKNPMSDMESSCCRQLKIPHTSSATSKGEPKVSLVNEGMTNVQEIADGERLSLLHNKYLSK